jgi:hypothetical protein
MLFIADSGQRDMDVTVLQPIADPEAAVLDEMHLDARMPATETAGKGSKHGFDILRAGPNAQRPDRAVLEGASAVTQRIRLLQEPAAAPHDVVTFRR